MVEPHALVSQEWADSVIAGVCHGNFDKWGPLTIDHDTDSLAVHSERLWVVKVPSQGIDLILTPSERCSMSKRGRSLFQCISTDAGMIGIFDKAAMISVPDGSRILVLSFEGSPLFTAFFKVVLNDEFVIND